MTRTRPRFSQYSFCDRETVLTSFNTNNRANFSAEKKSAIRPSSVNIFENTRKYSKLNLVLEFKGLYYACLAKKTLPESENVKARHRVRTERDF